jgi:hypothetical protein
MPLTDDDLTMIGSIHTLNHFRCVYVVRVEVLYPLLTAFHDWLNSFPHVIIHTTDDWYVYIFMAQSHSSTMTIYRYADEIIRLYHQPDGLKCEFTKNRNKLIPLQDHTSTFISEFLARTSPRGSYVYQEPDYSFY